MPQEAGDVDQRGAAGRAVAPSPPTRAVVSRPSSAGSSWLEVHGALERNAAVAVLGALHRRVLGPAGRGGALGRRGRTRQLRRRPARRQRFDRLVAGASCARMRCRRGAGEDARRRGARASERSPAASPLRPSASLLLAISHRWPASSSRPTTCSPTSPRTASRSGRSSRGGRARRARRDRDRAWGVGPGRGASRDRALQVIRRSRMDEYPTSAFVYAVAARVALHRGERRARPGAPRPGAAPAAAAHVRAAVPRRPDPPGARARLPRHSRRRRRRDDAARDRRAPAPAAGPRRRSRPRRRSCAPA